MANEEVNNEVWVKLVIDGDDPYAVIPCRITSDMNIVHDLKEAIVNRTPELMSRSIGPASLDVYVPKNATVPAGIEQPFRPDLKLSNLDFLGEITYQAPLIVTAKSLPQQQTDVRMMSAAVHVMYCFCISQSETFFLTMQVHVFCGSTTASRQTSEIYSVSEDPFGQQLCANGLANVTTGRGD
jgi:hypothetical protein